MDPGVGFEAQNRGLVGPQGEPWRGALPEQRRDGVSEPARGKQEIRRVPGRFDIERDKPAGRRHARGGGKKAREFAEINDHVGGEDEIEAFRRLLEECDHIGFDERIVGLPLPPWRACEATVDADEPRSAGSQMWAGQARSAAEIDRSRQALAGCGDELGELFGHMVTEHVDSCLSKCSAKRSK